MSARRLDRRARQHWHELTDDEKREAVINMHEFGYSVYVIACACGVSAEQIRHILAERREADV